MPKYHSKPLTWKEAEKQYLALGMTKDEFKALRAEYEAAGVMITEMSLIQSIERIKHELETVIAEKGTLERFGNWLTAGAMAVWSAAYVSLVFVQNMLGGYNRGRWDEINQQPAEIWVYTTMGDEKVRPTHAAMNKRAWPKAKFPMEWYPPNGFNCRCIVQTVTKAAAKVLGVKMQTKAPSGEPDEGFVYNQSQDMLLALELELEKARSGIGG